MSHRLPVITRGRNALAAGMALAGVLTTFMAAEPGQATERSEWFQAQDLMLSDRIFLRLAEQEWAGADFEVTVADSHTVTLSGAVPTDAAKQRVLRVARRTPGVHAVHDRLRVDQSVAAPRQTVPAAQLAQRVAESVAGAIPGAKAGEDWWFTGWRVEGPYRRWIMTVDADAGRISLDGDVPPRIARVAVQSALRTEGVRRVRSDFDLQRYYGDPYAPYGPYKAPYYRSYGYLYGDPYGPSAAYGRYGGSGSGPR